MRRSLALILVLIALAAGMVAAQSTPTPDPLATATPTVNGFEVVAELGRALPRNILYDPVFERYLVVDAYGNLLLRDALTFEDQKILYTSGNYYDFAFSHDGRYLALAIDSRVELWDAQTATLLASLTELGVPKRVAGPLTFSRDDQLLIFSGEYPAPRSIRVSENQTIFVPWVWHIPSALGENTSQYPGGAEAWQFFDYRNGFVIAPNNRLVAALPGRLQVLDGITLENLYDIPTDRYERDPLTVWFSARDEQVYIRPVTTNSLIQVDTERGVLVEIPLDKELSASDLALLGSIELSEQAQVLGDYYDDPLRRTLIGNLATQEALYRAGNLTVTLVDLVVPPVSTGDNILVLLFVYNEQTRFGKFTLTKGNTNQIVLTPDETELVIRQFDANNEESVVTYDIKTGEVIRSFIPSLRGIGGYRRINRNRVLAFNEAGDVIVSDFQRYDATTNAVITEDLTYSRRFDSFYFSDDSSQMVTLSGSEWRVWDIASGDVVRREVFGYQGSIVATSSDGHRFLVAENNGYSYVVYDFNNNSMSRVSTDFTNIPASPIEQVSYDSTWTNFLVVYSQNPYGEYAPGNQIAMYSTGVGFRWLIAGDDLPPAENRQYGFSDDKTVYISGEGYASEQQERVFGVEYDASRLPTCIAERFPDQISDWQLLWERQLYYLYPDQLHRLAQLICSSSLDDAANIENLLLPTSTPLAITPTLTAVDGVPECLIRRYPQEVETYTAIWRDVTQTLTEAQLAETISILCDGVGDYQPTYYQQGLADFYTQTMFVDIESGVRSSGAFQPVQVVRRPISPVLVEFEKQYKRQLGTAILSPDATLMAASSLPGELIIYRIVMGYETIMAQVTATAQAYQISQNLIYPQASPSPTFNAIGTPRPTLTPTMQPTVFPRATESLPEADVVERICPSETLFTVENPPNNYAPTGSIIMPITGDTLWNIDPLSGRRNTDENVPQCVKELQCRFSPDNQWILVNTTEDIYVIRPDGSDERLLYGKEDRKPDLYWANGNTLEYETYFYDEELGYNRYGLQRDILGVFPDPEPLVVEYDINTLPVEYVTLQPGGDWSVGRIPFPTGETYIYQYYLHNIVTQETVQFARFYQMYFEWSPQGDTLYFRYEHYDSIPYDYRGWYRISMDTLQASRVSYPPYAGIWSNDGELSAYSTNEQVRQIGIWNSQTGAIREYCLPETGAREFSGQLLWSPDNRYLAIRTFLPKDEAIEGVGQHLLIMDVATGEVVDVSKGILELISWLPAGGY